MSTLKRQRIEFEIFDKSIRDIEKLFSTDLKLPPLKAFKPNDTTPRHTASLFDRPKTLPQPQTKTHTHVQPTQHDNYTYKHSTSYTSLFSFGKTKTRETSVEEEIEPVKETRQKKRTHKIPRHRHRLLEPATEHHYAHSRHEIPAATAVDTDKNWSLWRSEVMVMIDFYANDLDVSVDAYADEDGFEECLKGIILGNR